MTESAPMPAFFRTFIVVNAVTCLLVVIVVFLQGINNREIERVKQHQDALMNRMTTLEGDMAALEQLVRDSTGFKVEPKGPRP